MIRRFIVMLIVVGLVLGGIFGWKSYASFRARQAMAAMPLPAITVSTAPAVAMRWMPTIPAVGTLRAVQGVDVTAQIAGQVTALHFDSGMIVAGGDPLVTQYSADDRARLAGLSADTRLAEINFRRAGDLVAKQLISALDFDARRNDLQRARAAEENLRLVIEQKSIRAPFAGRLGIRRVDIGQYIQPGDALARLEAVGKILVEFPLPQRYLGRIDVGRSIVVTTDAWPGEEFAGTVRAIEPQVSRTTRMINVQGIIANSDDRLLPGMFVRIAIAQPVRDDVVTVPQSAVTYSPYGDAVFVVVPGERGADGVPQLTVRNTSVTTGATRGDQVAVESGLEAGMTVVTSGQQKLRNGSRIRVDNSVPVGNQPDPLPADN